MVQGSCPGYCSGRPAGSLCLESSDGCTWLIFDSILGANETEEMFRDQPVQALVGAAAEHHDVLWSNLVQEVPR